jgi:hypothetical protein
MRDFQSHLVGYENEVILEQERSGAERRSQLSSLFSRWIARSRIPEPAPRVQTAQGLWLVFWCVLGSIWCLSSGRQIGATYDEPFNLEGGLKTWRTGQPGLLLQKGNMPLPDVVFAAPVRAWELLRGKPVDLDAEQHNAVALARPVNLVFWWLLVGYGFLLARRFGGPLAGWLAVPLLACEPNLLANAALATADIAVTAFLLMFLFHYHAGRDGRWWRRVGVPAVIYGVALLAKASTLVFGVLIMVTLEALQALERSAPQAGWRGRLSAIWSALLARPFRRDTVHIVALGLGLAMLACWSDWQPEGSFFVWSHGLSEGRLASVMVWLSEHLRIFPNGGQAIVRQIKHNIQGHGAYLLGYTDPKALWWFFPVALTIKLTLPLLLLPILLALLSPRSLCSRLAVLACVFLVFSLNCHVQIGIRMVFPLIVFIILAVCVALADAWVKTRGTWRGSVLAGVGGAALLWMVSAAVSAWPNGLQYVNEAWGGSAKGYLRVGGSDFDWGQGVPQLHRWAKGRSLALLYYGTDSRAEAPQYESFAARCNSGSGVSVATLAEQLRGRDLAVSISLLYGPPLGTPAFQHLLARLREREPIARTDCFFVYRFSGPSEG